MKYLPAAAWLVIGAVCGCGSYPFHKRDAGWDAAGASEASLVVTPTAHDFGTVVTGRSSSPPAVVTISNRGGKTSGFLQLTVSGEFTQTSGCTTLPPGGSCTAAVSFRPTVAGVAQGAFTAAAVPGGTARTILTGVGVIPGTFTGALTVDPSLVQLPATLVGESSDSQMVVVRNRGEAAVERLAVWLEQPEGFQMPSTCSGRLAAQSACAFTVVFAPRRSGLHSTNLVITGAAEPVFVPLTAVALRPAALDWYPKDASFDGKMNRPLTVTLVNPGDQPTGIPEVALEGINRADFTIARHTCLDALGARGTCTVDLVFTPTGPGPKSAQLVVTAAPGGRLSVALGGDNGP